MKSAILRRTMIMLAIVGIAFPLSSAFAQKTYSLSGKVFADDSKKAIQASILIYSASSSKTGEFAPMYKVATDPDGYYSIALPADDVYKVQAYPWNNDYAPQFYGNVQTEKESKDIRLTQDVSGVDFALQAIKKFSYKNSLRGVVVAVTGEALFSKIALISSSSQYSYGVATDQFGKFSLENIAPGKYAVYASPANTKFEPGFYAENSVATSDMKGATIISVNETGDIELTSAIILGEAKIPTPTYMLAAYVVELGTNAPINNAGVSITDAKGNIVISSEKLRTDANGVFYVTLPESGTYHCTISHTDYKTYEYDVTLNEKNPAQKDILTMMPKGLSVTGVNESSVGSGLNIYPNPASSSLNLAFGGNVEGNVDIKILTVAGIVAESQSLTVSGQNSLPIDISRQAAGVFIIRVEQAGKILHESLFVKK